MLRAGMRVLDLGRGRGSITLGLPEPSPSERRSASTSSLLGSYSTGSERCVGSDNARSEVADVYSLTFPDGFSTPCCRGVDASARTRPSAGGGPARAPARRHCRSS